MLPLNEPNVVGQIDEEYVRAIIKTILEITIVSWCQIVARGEICSSSDERDIAGCLYREMYAEKRRRLGHSWAAMLGFVIDGKSTDCIKMVTNHLIKTKGKNRMKNNWTTETSFGPHKDLYRTRHHQRGRNSLMTILHLFLTIPPTLSIETNGNEPLLNLL